MSQFTDHLGLQMIENAAGRPILTGDGRSQWSLTAPLTYDVGREGSGETITVPVGATTDLASVPRFAWSLLPPDGPWTKAAVVHDFLYRTRGTGVFAGRCWITRRGGYTRAQSDRILNEAMAALGVRADKRLVIFVAVRLCGGSGWGRSPDGRSAPRDGD
ncbi:MAG: DUF1353 domain-containing protein [Caulobacterales bacterium]